MSSDVTIAPPSTPTTSNDPLQFVKAGFAADNLPRYIFPSIVGRPVLRAEEEAIGDVELKVRGNAPLQPRVGEGCARVLRARALHILRCSRATLRRRVGTQLACRVFRRRRRRRT